MRRHVVYLHGFASSAQSSKARFFRDKLQSLGLDLICPDLNAPDFEGLTITRMLDDLARTIRRAPPGPVALIGSSLGAFVAVEAAVSRNDEASRPIDRLVLLAPALDFSLRNDRQIGPAALETWRTTGALEVFHHGFGEMRRVGYALYLDAQRYDPFHADLQTPTLVVQGTGDETVNPAMVQRFAAAHSSVTLRLVDDDHQLHASLDFIWHETVTFLGLG